MPENRRYIRTPMKCQLKVWHELFGELVVSTRDISDGGVFLLTEQIEMPPVGEVLKGQVQGLATAAPVVEMRIVRVESTGIGLKFIVSQ